MTTRTDTKPAQTESKTASKQSPRVSDSNTARKDFSEAGRLREPGLNRHNGGTIRFGFTISKRK